MKGTKNMKEMPWNRVLGVIAITLTAGLTLAAQSGDPAALQQKLYAQFKLTTTTADRSDIVTPGDVVDIHAPGLVMYSSDSPLPPSNTYKHGRISQGWGGFGKDLAISMVAPGGATAANYPHRTFVPEEKCWVTGINVEENDVLFNLYSDPYDGIRYYANLKIPFPKKKTVPSADEFLPIVAEVLTVVPQDNQGDQGQGNQSQGDQGGQQAMQPPTGPAEDSVQGSQQVLPGEYTGPGGARILLLPDDSFTKFVAGGQGHGQFSVNGATLTLTFSSTGFSQQFQVQGNGLLDGNTGQLWTRTGDAPAAAPAPMPAIAPPPPPADTPPPTIALGQTIKQVLASFGPPQREVKLGVKVIFYYKDMKVTFKYGKVSDVE